MRRVAEITEGSAAIDPTSADCLQSFEKETVTSTSNRQATAT